LKYIAQNTVEIAFTGAEHGRGWYEADVLRRLEGLRRLNVLVVIVVPVHEDHPITLSWQQWQCY
jgi:hypothetical protein